MELLKIFETKEKPAMKIFKIQKGHKTRTVYALNNKEKKYNKQYKPELQELCLKYCDPEVVHGFMPFRSAVTNARQHVGYNYSLVNDLRDFFDSVRVEHLSNFMMDKNILRDCFYMGAPRQGYPTSPLIANLACVSLDERIKSSISIIEENAVYTRYADDLTISFNEIHHLPLFKGVITDAVSEFGFSLNKAKTKLYSAIGGAFRSVTGISVGMSDIQPPRHLKRKLRAARHQNNGPTIAGLEEYMSFKGLGL